MVSDPDGPWRRVQVPRDRLVRWLTTFDTRHGPVRTQTAGAGPADDPVVRVEGADGAIALITPVLDPPEPGDQPATLVQQLGRDDLVGLVMVRKGGHAIGLARGDRLVRHVCGHRYVQGRTKAGGWSQQRYARRRAGQARAAYARASDDAARLLTGSEVRAVACAGDRTALAALWSDPRLTPLADRWDGRTHPCAEPRLRALEDFAVLVRGVTIDLNAAAQV